MANKNMNTNELASMLGADYHRLTRMARCGEIPCKTIRGEFRFNSMDIFIWLQDVLPAMTQSELIQMDIAMSQYRGVSSFPPMVSQLVHSPAISSALGARTQNSLKRKLVGMADNTDCVYDSQTLLDHLVIRTLPSGTALLHPTQALPHALSEPVIAMAKTLGPIMVNQGTYTNLFFLCAARDESHHLHLLTRLCRLLQDQDLRDQLEQADTPLDMIEAVRNAEDSLIACAV